MLPGNRGLFGKAIINPLFTPQVQLNNLASGLRMHDKHNAKSLPSFSLPQVGNEGVLLNELTFPECS